MEIGWYIKTKICLYWQTIILCIWWGWQRKGHRTTKRISTHIKRFYGIQFGGFFFVSGWFSNTVMSDDRTSWYPCQQLLYQQLVPVWTLPAIFSSQLIIWNKSLNLLVQFTNYIVQYPPTYQKWLEIISVLISYLTAKQSQVHLWSASKCVFYMTQEYINM